MNTFTITYSQSINRLHPPPKAKQQTKPPKMTEESNNQQMIGLRVLTAMIAVLALAFLAMLASLIALKWELLKSRETNGNVLDRYGMIFSNSRRPKAVRNRSLYLANFWYYLLLKWCAKYCIDIFRCEFSFLWKILRSPWGVAIGEWKSSLKIEEINSLSL